jgi:hypothetical protein
MNIAVIAYQAGEKLQKPHAFLRNLSTVLFVCVLGGGGFFVKHGNILALFSPLVICCPQ